MADYPIFELKARSQTSEDGTFSVEQVPANLKVFIARPEEVIFIPWANWSFDPRLLGTVFWKI